MNRDDIIRIAQQFGAVAIVDGHVVWATASGDIVRKLMTAAVEAEREECAKLCESLRYASSNACGHAIRARSEMTTLRQAAEMALEALERCQKENKERLDSMGIIIYTGEYHATSAINELLEALAQPEQEPVAYRYKDSRAHYRYVGNRPNLDINSYVVLQLEPLYLHPVPIPEGWQLVPKEPTAGMIEAGSDYGASTVNSGARPTTEGYYVAMLAAAPKPEDA